MKTEELIKRFSCGPILHEYENAKSFIIIMQLVFTGVGAYFLLVMMTEAMLAEKLDNIAVLMFCLWRIHRQRDILCYTTEKGIIVRRQFMSLREFFEEQIHPDRAYVFVPYKHIFLVSDNWQSIELGAAEEGGIAVLPVHLQFLSRKAKQELLDRIKEGQDENKPEEENK